MGVLRMGYVHAKVTDLAEAKQHYGSTLGLYETRSEPGRVFYKGWDEWDHHSVVLEEGGVGLAKMGYKVADPDDIEIYEKRAEQFGCIVAADGGRGEPGGQRRRADHSALDAVSWSSTTT